jgi:hypothetical protein
MIDQREDDQANVLTPHDKINSVLLGTLIGLVFLLMKFIVTGVP